VAKEPCGFVADAQHAADLKGAHALLRRHHKVRRGQPFVEWDVASLIERADRHGERLSASVALIQTGAMRLAVHECRFTHRPAFWADRAVGPDALLKPLASFGFVSENRV